MIQMQFHISNIIIRVAFVGIDISSRKKIAAQIAHFD